MKYIQLAFVLILFIGCNSSKNSIKKHSKKLGYDIEFIDYLFKDYNGKKPSASFIIIKDGKPELAKSYGFADIENEIRATPRTNYRIASVTKQFTAIAIMILVHEGKLSYETKLTEIFPEFPEYGKDISIRHLLAHRSGLVRYNRFLEEGSTKQMLDKDVFNGLLKTDSTYFFPGTQYAYCNTSYAVLAQIIEKISRISFAEFMQKEIFEPLRMKNSMVLEIDKKIENRAYGYLVKGASITPKDQSLTSAIQGDGGIYSSVLDYYLWDKALYTDKLLPQSELDSAFYNYDENGKSDKNGYGYGWVVQNYRGTKILQHGGSSSGFGSHVIRIPSENISVAIFTNRNKQGKELSLKAKALISHFTNGRFKMPFEIVLEKEIEEKGIEKGLKLYEQIKTDTLNYSVSKGELFRFAISYINNNRSDEAFSLFEQLTVDYPEYFGGYYGKAIILKKQGQKEQAIEHFQKTIKYCSGSEKWAANHSRKMIKELDE